MLIGYMRVTEAACWAHARRKIHDVHVRTPSALTEEALKRIGELYAIEAEILYPLCASLHSAVRAGATFTPEADLFCVATVR